jgi:galacturonokinase
MSRTDHNLWDFEEYIRCLWSRFSGAVYRGCCIGLVDPKYQDAIKEKMDEVYPVKHPQYKEEYNVHF